MSELAFDSLVEGKPVAIDHNGVTVCVARVGDEVFAIEAHTAHTQRHHFLKVR